MFRLCLILRKWYPINSMADQRRNLPWNTWGWTRFAIGKTRATDFLRKPSRRFILSLRGKLGYLSQLLVLFVSSNLNRTENLNWCKLPQSRYMDHTDNTSKTYIYRRTNQTKSFGRSYTNLDTPNSSRKQRTLYKAPVGLAMMFWFSSGKLSRILLRSSLLSKLILNSPKQCRFRCKRTWIRVNAAP